MPIAHVAPDAIPQAVAGELRITLYLPNCPKCDSQETVVTCTRGPIRHCRCRDCGWTFRVLSRVSKGLATFLRQLPQGICPIGF